MKIIFDNNENSDKWTTWANFTRVFCSIVMGMMICLTALNAWTRGSKIHPYRKDLINTTSLFLISYLCLCWMYWVGFNHVFWFNLMLNLG